MLLRCYTLLVYRLHTFKLVKITCVVLGFLLMESSQIQAQNSLNDVKKEANKLFEDDEFTKAYKLYAQLVSNFPNEAEYNYRLGVCMIFSEPNKKKCIPYLKQAANGGKEAPKDVNFYLGKAYHINYLFDEAIKCYNEFKKTAPAALQKKLQVDREIKSCNNGKFLLSNLTDLVVQTKKELNEADYFRSYDLKSIGGKLLVKPDDFKTPVDKKKKEKSVVFLPKGGEVVYYSSYGENPENGKDIYTIAKIGDGSFGKPQKVQGINTEFDEDYPFLHPDGKTLYFASKGYNSMGGYDIFKSVFSDETNTWSTPINLEFPVNSPDDDFLYVTDSLEKTAYFSTGRQSAPGKIDVLKINTERKPLDVIIVNGTVLKTNDDQNVTSKITVKDIATNKAIGKFQAKEDGEYNMVLPNGSKLLFDVETEGQKPQSQEVSLPIALNSKPYKQSITYENGKLKISEILEDTDSDYMDMLEIIEEKAKLDVNEGENKLELNTTKLATNEQKTNEPKKVNKPKLIEEENNSSAVTNNPTPTSNVTEAKPVDNKQLADLAMNDAQELKQEADQLSKDAKDAIETGQKQKIEAEKRLAEAEEAIKIGETIQNEEEKKNVLGKAIEQKKSAESDITVATKILEYATSLEKDAAIKKKESEMNEEYSRELQKIATNKNNSQAVARAEELQKILNKNEPAKTESESIVTNIKVELEQKENQLGITEKIGNELRNNLEEIKTNISTTEAELEKTKKKSVKENITQTLNNLKIDKEEKEKEIAANTEESEKLTREINELKSELELTNKIKTEEIVKTPAPLTQAEVKTIPTNTRNTNSTEIDALASKYANKFAVNATDRISINDNIAALNSYNSEIDALIAKNKQALTKAKTATDKQKITSQNKQLESTKKQNQTLITNNKQQLQNITANIANNTNPAETFKPLEAKDTKDAIGKLDILNEQLLFNDNPNFDFNSYQNNQAQTLKVEADSKINEAVARQKKLKEEILNSITILKNNKDESNAPVNVVALNTEAEELHNQSVELFKTAKTKEGVEKNRLLEDAKKLDEKANENYIQIAHYSEKENKQTFELNNDNIKNLIAEGKASEAEINQARELNEAASSAFRNAIEIRKEAETLDNQGAKLGSFSNAEEKEAEAILKQQQAVDILKKSNPDFVLKTASPNSENSTSNNVSPQLEKINAGLNELAEIKVASYQKLNSANATEIEQNINSIETNNAIINNNPRLKTDYVTLQKKIQEAKKLFDDAQSSENKGAQLAGIIASVKKQNEAIKDLNTLNKNINNQLALNNPNKNSPEFPEDPIFMNPEVNDGTNNSSSEPTKPAVQNQPTVELKANKPVAPVTSVDTKETLKTLESTENNIKNSQAKVTFRNSLNQLKQYESEISNLDNSANNNNDLTKEVASGFNSVQLKNKSDSLTMAGEELNSAAFKKRKEADLKSGDEKEELLKQAKEIEERGLDLSIEGANYLLRSNEMDVEANTIAIKELLNKLETDNPELKSELSESEIELQTLHNKALKLRDEANLQPSRAARIGALSNAEEKEAELIAKQEELIATLKKQYPDYEVKPISSEVVINKPSTKSPQEVAALKTDLRNKQFSEMTNLTNSINLEYENIKNGLSKKLSKEQLASKQKSDKLNADSKNLLVKSSKEKNETEKLKLLNQSIKLGNDALNQLNQLPTATPAELETPVVQNTTNNPPKNITTPNNKPQPESNTNNTKATVKVPGLEVIKGTAYSDTKPIPVDAKIEDGLVFRVQIGAFKTQLANNTFKGLTPLNAESTTNGYFRYTAGNFNKIENANAVKNDLRGLGYPDAFVVAYYNGKRVSIAEAIELLAKEGKAVDANAPQTAGITLNTNIPVAAKPTPIEKVEVTKELEKVNGLLYTIQIGVYNRQVSKQQLLGLRPIFTEQLPNGLYRYTAGIYSNADKLIVDKNKVISFGIKDAFVSAYLNGKKIAFAEAKQKQNTDASIKLETENPVIFPDANIAAAPNTALNASPNEPATAVKPFENGVTSYPDATPENGIKKTEAGICFKVQVGAYSKQVPNDVAAKLSAIKNWPVENKQINTLFIYNIGNFAEPQFAKALKEEALKLGLTDAFITVYKDGQKLYGEEATRYLNR